MVLFILSLERQLNILFYNIRGSKSAISHLVKEQWQGLVQTGTEPLNFLVPLCYEWLEGESCVAVTCLMA